MKRVRTAQASVVSSDSEEGNVPDSQPAKKPRKSSSVKSKAKPSPDVEAKTKRAKVEKKEGVEGVSGSKAVKRDEVRGQSWTPADVISRDLHLDLGVTQNTVSLLQAGNSVPFLAR